jgi:DNA-binding transcriptional regulator YiaG
MKKLKGAGGLDNVYLTNGYDVDKYGSTAYADIDGLFDAIAGAIAMRPGALTGPQLRALRRSLGMTQDEVGALGGKSSQAVAQWEKGQAAVSLAESSLLRLIWLERHSKRHLSAAVRMLCTEGAEALPVDFVMSFQAGRWVEDIAMAHQLARERTAAAMGQALAAATEGGSTASGLEQSFDDRAFYQSGESFA